MIVMCKHCLWLIIFASFSNQVDGLHQQIIVKVLVDLEQKEQTDFAKGKGKNQSGKVKDEVFEVSGFLFNFHVVKRGEVRSRIVISEVCLGASQLFGVDEFEGLSPNVVKCSILCFEIYIHISETKDPHVSEVNEGRGTVRIYLLHFYMVIIVEGKADLANGGRLLVFGCVDNEAL